MSSGTIMAGVGAAYPTGGTAWNLTLDVPPWTIEESGRAVTGEGQTAAGDTPRAFAHTSTAPGEASIRLEETHTGRAGPDTPLGFRATLVTWGWVDADLWEAFGWRHDHAAYPEPHEPTAGAPRDVAATGSPLVCPALAELAGCWTTPGFASGG